MENKRFTKNDSGFLCGNCGKEVPPLRYSSRNHCPFCLWSLHVDLMPGDRACECRGLMRPVSVEVNSRKGYIITHKCTKCGEVKRNRSQQDDDINLIIRLTNPFNADDNK